MAAMIVSGLTRSSASGPGRRLPGRKSTIANAALRLEDAVDAPQQILDDLRARRFIHLAIRVHDQHRIETRRQPWIRRRAEHRTHVGQRFLLHAAVGCFDHLRLDVLRVDESVRPDAARQPDGEPAAAGAKIGHDRAVGNPERVHDQVRLAPVVPIRRGQQSEILRREQPSLTTVCCGGAGGGGAAGMNAPR